MQKKISMNNNSYNSPKNCFSKTLSKTIGQYQLPDFDFISFVKENISLE